MSYALGTLGLNKITVLKVTSEILTVRKNSLVLETRNHILSTCFSAFIIPTLEQKA